MLCKIINYQLLFLKEYVTCRVRKNAFILHLKSVCLCMSWDYEIIDSCHVVVDFPNTQERSKLFWEPQLKLFGMKWHRNGLMQLGVVKIFCKAGKWWMAIWKSGYRCPENHTAVCATQVANKRNCIWHETHWELWWKTGMENCVLHYCPGRIQKGKGYIFPYTLHTYTNKQGFFIWTTQ